MAIYFYKINEKYGCFSNFAHYDFELNGKRWMTSEHYFQAQKFFGTEYEEIIRLLDSPMKAAEMGGNRDLPLREDWEQVKDNIMRRVVYAKFTQNKEIRDILFLLVRKPLLKKQPMIIIGDVERMVQGKIC